MIQFNPEEHNYPYIDPFIQKKVKTPNIKGNNLMRTSSRALEMIVAALAGRPGWTSGEWLGACGTQQLHKHRYISHMRK
jgi:hypothetical protein